MTEVGEGIQVDALPDDLIETIQVIVSSENIKKEQDDKDFYVTVDQAHTDNEFFVIEEYEEPHGAIVHPSIGSNRKEFIRRFKSTNQCYLCDEPQDNVQIIPHFITVHLKYNLHIDGKLIVLCKLGCKKAAHFHCPYPDCLFSSAKRSNLKKHYYEHDSQTENALLHAEIDGFNVKQEPELSEYTEIECFANSEESESREIIQNYGIEETMLNDIIIDSYSDLPSVSRDEEGLMNKLVTPFCYLCSDYKYYVHFKLEKHFNQVHLGHSVKFNGCVVAVCRMNCNSVNNSHFHCPIPECNVNVRSKNLLISHCRSHFFNDNQQPNSISKIDIKDKMLVSAKKKGSDLPPPKKSFPFHGVQYFPHESIRPTAEDLFDYLCLPYCYLCDSHNPAYYYTMGRLERHFRMAHMNRGVDCGSCYLVLCGLDCLPDGKNRKHYHCPFCAPDDRKRCISTSRYRFWVHLESHRREMFVPKNGVKPNMLKMKNSNSGQSLIKRDFRHSAEMNNVISEQNWNVQYNGYPVIHHPSINTNIDVFLDVAELPTCYLCSDDKDHIYHKRLLSHVSKVHLKPMFQVENIIVALCKRLCTPNTHNRGHYHCFLCDFFALHKGRLEIHLAKHISNMRKKSVMSELSLPDVVQDHSVPEEWIQEDNRSDVKEWEKNFNGFVNDYAISKTHNKVITEKMKWLIYNHVKFGVDIDHRNLKYWVQFRRINVICCSQLDLDNVLVMPLTKYNNLTLDKPELDYNENDLILKSSSPLDEFFERFRLIPTCEEMFKLLYHMHVMNENHPTAKIMFGNIRRKYLYLPRNIVDKFVELCPSCCSNIPDNSALPPAVSFENGDLINLAGIQLTVVDMTEHPDGKYNYVVECFDRCSRLTWLFPSERAVASELVDNLLRSVFSVSGLPCYIITNCGFDFLERMLDDIQRRWNGSCSSLVSQSREAANSLQIFSSDDLMDILQDIVFQHPNTWSQTLPHIQYRLNHSHRHRNDDMSPYEVVLGRKRLSRLAENINYSSGSVEQIVEEGRHMVEESGIENEQEIMVQME